MTQTTTGFRIITRIVTNINRDQSPEEMLTATGRKQFTNSDVVSSMPHGTGDGNEVLFINLDGFINDDDLEDLDVFRGTIPCDPYTLGKINQDDPTFADIYPNATHWKGSNGVWRFASFDLWANERHVHVDRRGDIWYGNCWFARLRKPV